MNRKIVKEVAIIALLAIVVVFIIGILLYDFIPFKDEITSATSSKKYSQDESVLKTIEEIDGNTNKESTNENSLLKSYSLDKEDLNIYATQNSYESGKKDPFAEYSEPIEETVRTETTEGIQNNAHTSNPINVENVQNTSNNTMSVNENKNTEEDTVKKKNAKEELKIEAKENSSSTTGTFFEKKDSK